jgi:hypothetical protein
MRRIAAAVLVVWALVPVSLFAFSYTGAGSNGFASGESVTPDNMNELDTALDGLEAPTYILRTASSAVANETAMGALGTGLVLNATTTGTPSIYGGTSCTDQFPRSANASGAWTCATVATTDVASGVTLDADTTVTCITTKQFFAPEGGEALSLYRVPFATTLVRYSAYILPTSITDTTTLTLRECSGGQQSCGNNDSNYTANSDGATWDTSFSDSTIDADDSVMILVNTPSGDLSGASVNVDLCYSRAVVQ